jgi:SAM-dependent methyltransferase
MVSLATKISSKREAEYQTERWKTKFLVRSRENYWKQMKKRPWISYFYKSILASTLGQYKMILLDVGCGTGFFTRLFGRQLIPSQRISGIVGLDLNRKLLQEARKAEESKSRGSKRAIEYVQGDAYHLPFRPNEFGLVTSRTMLMHLSSPLKALREMTRVCRKEGRVLSLEPDWGMFAIYNPKDSKSELEDTLVLRAEIRGGKKLYGRDAAIGRRLPDLFYRAGLRDFTIDGAFEGVNVPCDSRTDAKCLRAEYNLSLENLRDEKYVQDYVKTLVAGGLTKKKAQRYLKRYKRQLLRRLKQVGTKKSKESMTRFFSAPLFVAVGKK